MSIELSRRGFVQTGFTSALGLALPRVLHARTQAEVKPLTAPTKKARSVILVFLTGAASHLDTFDMKPEAPAEIRGQFQPIATSVPGLQICEHLPMLASRMHRCALVRSMAHREDNHLLATHQVLTGTAIPNGIFDQIASRNDWPCYAGGLSYSHPRNDGVPTGVTLPTFLMEGPLIWPGQHAGFLGARHDPWHIKQDPNKPDFRVDALRPMEGADRLRERRTLLEQIHSHERTTSSERAVQSFSEQQEQAFSILSSGRVAQSFELEREPVVVRDRYGRHTYGQSLLTARRLIEAGVSIVQVNMGIVQTWDSHTGIFPRLKDQLLPPTDRGVSALLDDLHDRGLLDDTLVAMFGEFGRTPKINKDAGRDHWGRSFFALFAGGGVRGGLVIGKTNSTAAVPATPPFSPMDLGATIYEALGFDPHIEMRDSQNRPIRLNTGTPMSVLYS